MGSFWGVVGRQRKSLDDERYMEWCGGTQRVTWMPAGGRMSLGRPRYQAHFEFLENKISWRSAFGGARTARKAGRDRNWTLMLCQSGFGAAPACQSPWPPRGADLDLGRSET